MIAIDTHADTTQRMLDTRDNLAMRLPDGHLDLPRMREGGLSGVFLSIWVDPHRYPGEDGWARTRALIGAVHDFVTAHPEEVVLAKTAGEVRTAHAANRIALLMGLEGAHGLGDADDETLLSRLAQIHADGVRYVTLTWTNDNRFGHASTGAHPSRGLTRLGRRLVGEMNRLGMIIDVSHVSDRTAHDALDISTRPVLASHSAVRALGAHPRNIPDDLIRRIAERGGAVCVNYYAHFIDPNYGVARRALEHEHRAAFAHLRGRSWQTAAERNAIAARIDPALRPPELRVLADHIAHVVQVGSPAAACLGSDFDGVSELPEGMRDVTDLPQLFEELTRRELPVAMIAGENVLRVLAAQEPE
jgi:membrane dipeptidase